MIEKIRHKSEDLEFTLFLKFNGRIAGLHKTEHKVPTEKLTKDNRFSMEYGLNSEIVFFWDSRFEELSILTPSSLWVKKVLPCFGFNKYKFIEIAIPDNGPYFTKIDGKKIFNLFEEATRDYNSGRYKESISKCRDIRNILEDKFQANKKNPIGTKIGELVGWGEDDDRIKFINHCWDALITLSNAACHVRDYKFSFADAHAFQSLFAVLLDYLSNLSDNMKMYK